ncbi:hypothetical protein V8D89_006338 [Ganoderma adspersum]
MLAKRTLENALITLAIVALALNTILKFCTRTVIDRAQAVGNENDGKGGIWSIERKEVALQFDSWTRGLRCFKPEGGVIHLGPERTPYIVSMMHQLRCLDVIRDQLSQPKIRQMVTCRGDLQFDPIQYPHNVNALHPHAVRRCRDWRAAYGAVWRNQKEHRDLLKERMNTSSDVGK